MIVSWVRTSSKYNKPESSWSSLQSDQQIVNAPAETNHMARLLKYSRSRFPHSSITINSVMIQLVNLCGKVKPSCQYSKYCGRGLRLFLMIGASQPLHTITWIHSTIRQGVTLAWSDQQRNVKLVAAHSLRYRGHVSQN